MDKIFILWIFGVPGSGKTTIANKLKNLLHNKTELIDGDDIIKSILPNPKWDDDERNILYRSMVEMAKRLYVNNISSIITACAGGFNLESILDKNYNIILVHLSCSLDIAAQRQKNNLYKKVQNSEIPIPLIRINSKYPTESEDWKFAKANNIHALKIVLPTCIGLELETNEIDKIDDNILKIRRLIEIQ